MKATLESTSKIVDLVKDGTSFPARIWEGETEAGVQFHAYITRVAAHEDADPTQFEKELTETRAPSPEVQSIDMRLIL